MRADFLDRYSHLDSPVHRLPAGGKALLALALVVLIVALPARLAWGLAGVAVLLALVAALSRIPARFLLVRMLWMEPLVIGVAGLSLLQPGGWRIFLLLVARCSLCLATMLLLSNTTSFSELLRVLRRCRMPGLLVTTIALMHRYLFVLAEETARMKRARAGRTFAPDRRGIWRGGAGIIAQLFVRATARAERIYAAMSARGWE